MLGGCAVFPVNHIFNTPIDTLPVDAGSKAFLDTIGAHNIHLDLGTSVDPKSADYYGIPYNVVHSKAIPWVNVTFSTSSDSTADEGDCAVGAAHTFTSPCIGAAAAKPQFPIPAAPLVEGGIETDPAKYGDHHVLLLDADTCGLWELYHVYPDPKGGWDIFGSAYFDLRSNALRPAGWTSADAAGFPILPLLLRADEASSGTITHALRFTIESSDIRQQYTWPARHLTTNGTMSSRPAADGSSIPDQVELHDSSELQHAVARYSASSEDVRHVHRRRRISLLYSRRAKRELARPHLQPSAIGGQRPVRSRGSHAD